MLKEIREDIKFTYLGIKEYFMLKRFSLSLKLAIKLAIMKQNAFNKAFYVVLGPDNRPIALSKRDIKRLQRENVIDRRLPWYEILDRALFYTSKETKKPMTKEDRKQKKKEYMEYIKLLNKK